MPTSILWFRRDLRLSDHPALVEAVHLAGADGQVVAAFCLDDRLWSPAGGNRRAFLVGSLGALDDALGGHLVVRHGDPARVLPALAREVGAEQVVVTGDFGPYGAARDLAVEDALHSAGVGFARVSSPYAVDPGSVRTGGGQPYKVFTPFSRAWAAYGWSAPVRAPGSVPWATGVRSDGLPEVAASGADLPAPGEAAAKAAARRFYDRRLDAYDE